MFTELGSFNKACVCAFDYLVWLSKPLFKQCTRLGVHNYDL